MQVAGSQLRNPPVKFRQERWLHIWRSISIQHVQMEASLTSDPGNDSFWDKIRDTKHVDRSTPYLVQCHEDRCRWRSHQLTSDLKRCLLFQKCLRWSSRKAVSVPTSVKGGLRAPERLAILLGVCRCVIVVTMRGWADVGLWVAVCFLAKISLHRPNVCMLDTVTGNLAVISCVHHTQINERYDFFSFSKLFFIQNYRFLYHGDQNISWRRICRWRAVNFEIHWCSSGMNCDCIWRSISIQYVQIEPGVNFDLGNDSF